MCRPGKAFARQGKAHTVAVDVRLVEELDHTIVGQPELAQHVHELWAF